jgi:hypothetical protein
VVVNIVLLTLGGFIFLFTLWKRLKEDYFDNQVFTTGFYIFTLVALMNLISWYFLKSHWFWLSLLGVLLGAIAGTFRFKLRFFEVLEACVVALFAPSILFLIYDGIRLRHASSFFAISIIALFIGLFYIFSTRYRTFTWYRSGRVGFAGLAILGLFFLVRALIAIWFPHVVSFVDRDWLISGSLAFITFLALLNLSFKVQ